MMVPSGAIPKALNLSTVTIIFLSGASLQLEFFTFPLCALGSIEFLNFSVCSIYDVGIECTDPWSEDGNRRVHLGIWSGHGGQVL